MSTEKSLGSSFRDPSGTVIWRDGALVRSVAPSYLTILQSCESTGLFEELWSERLLVRHETFEGGGGTWLRPEFVPLISYPYEWCFGQLKDAALLTLDLHSRALKRGLALKDASAYNVQFLDGRPIFIDTLSFEPYKEGEPWKAYRQFCEHFLAPLALMSYVDARLNKLLVSFIDGVPLDMASGMLPGRTKIIGGLAMHVHLHGKAQRGGKDGGRSSGSFSKVAMLGLVDSLRRTVESLTYNPEGTVWSDYYSDTNYSAGAFAAKKDLVARFLSEAAPRSVWDLGANVGEFSQIAADMGCRTVAWDFDVAAVEKAYRTHKGQSNFLPLVVDLTNPSPAIGWHNAERESFIQRCEADCVMALALVHHLAIGKNVPLSKVADFFSELAPNLIIEFVPKNDSQVQRLLSTREDIYDRYDSASFVSAFSERFQVLRREAVPGTERELFLMRRL